MDDVLGRTPKSERAGMSATTEYAAVRHVLQQYIDASFTADVPSLKSVFHPDALMAGYLEGVLDVGSPEPFYVDLEENPSSQETGEPYRAEIVFIVVAGPIASAAVAEDDLMGFSFVNHFHLLKIDGKWRIVSKIYTSIDRVQEKRA